MSYVKVEGHHGYVRDRTGAVLNTNKEEIKAAQKRKADRKNLNKYLLTPVYLLIDKF